MTSKQVNVSVTILSISGLHVKDTAIKKKSGVLRGISPSRAFPSRSLSPARRKKGINLDVDTQSCAPSTTSSSNNNITDNSNDKSSTTVVTSFTRMAKKKKRMTHVGSLPLQLSSDEYDCDADIQWPTIDTLQQKEGVSSHYRFMHTFDKHEESNDPSLSSRLQQKEEQEALMQIAISRQGRMFKLGTASIPLSADTRSGSFVYTLPITNCNPIKSKKNGVNKPMMMKLKDDTIKVSMDTDATIKIRVAVSPSIGETVTISERFNVTMITDSMIKQKEMHDMKMKEKQMKEELREMSLQKDVIAAKKEEQPTLEDVSTTTTAPSSPGSTAQIIEDDTLPMIRVMSHPEDEQDDPQEDTEETQDVEDNEEDDDDDEASCSSSAYMSVPSKYQGHNLSVTRSNSATTTDMSSVVSDLTEGCSFLSQNGIEVVPFNTTPDHTKLSSNPNINTMMIDSKEGVRDSQPNLNSTQSRAESEDTHSVDPSVPVPKSSSFPHRAADSSSNKRQTWRERFSCVGLNSALLMCGDKDGNDISETLSSVIEEDVVSTNKYSLENLGRCHNPLSIPSASYYTDDGSFVEDDEDSDDVDESSSSSESSGGRDERYTALEGALFG